MYLHLTGWHEMEVGCGIYQMAGLTVHDKCWFDWWQDGDLKMASSSFDRHVYMGLVSKAPMQEWTDAPCPKGLTYFWVTLTKRFSFIYYIFT